MAIQILKATEMTIQSYTLAFSVAGKMLTMAGKILTTAKENAHNSKENMYSPWQGRWRGLQPHCSCQAPSYFNGEVQLFSSSVV